MKWGLVEPPVVARADGEKHKYLLLDGHLRLEALREVGMTEVSCLIATDDEAFTYNKRISRIATIQERNMILTAIKRGVPEERIAKVLNVDVSNIQIKKRLLDGICPEAVEFLKDKHVPINTFAQLKKMLPMRQIEAAQLMVAMNKYSIPFAKSLVNATPPDQLVDWAKPKQVDGLTAEQITLMEQESEKLDREFRLNGAVIRRRSPRSSGRGRLRVATDRKCSRCEVFGAELLRTPRRVSESG